MPWLCNLLIWQRLSSFVDSPLLCKEVKKIKG
jgi:hypothetical protein